MKNEFDNKTKEYAIGRPAYPREVIEVIRGLGIDESAVIADVAAGTGLLTKMLGEIGCEVYAIEPSEEMLNECKKTCENLQTIHCIHAPAEKTGLVEHNVDLITVAQAFHWFDKELCKTEFKRILKEDGKVMILWNELQTDSPFAKEYTDTLYQYRVKRTAAIESFDPDLVKWNFFGQGFKKLYFDNFHSVHEESFIGGALSLSYTPSKGDDLCDKFVQDLRKLFAKYQVEGQVTTFHYKTEVSIGQFLN